MLEDSIVYRKAFLFSVEIIRFCRSTDDKSFIEIYRQLLRSGTSIGANIAEANGSLTKAEFSSKMSIALKEAMETRYWLALLKESELMVQ